MRDEAGGGADPIAEGLEGLSPSPPAPRRTPPRLAALLMREALETPGRTVRPGDARPALARRVAARLARWGVMADSSAG